MRKRIKLTALGLERLKPPSSGRDEYADTLVPGLTLRVTDKDHRSYSLLYRVRGSGGETKAGLPKRGTLRRLTLRATELAAARDEARRATEQADAGRDPAMERLREVLDNREIAANTFGVLADQFLEEHRKERNRPGAARRGGNGRSPRAAVSCGPHEAPAAHYGRGDRAALRLRQRRDRRAAEGRHRSLLGAWQRAARPAAVVASLAPADHRPPPARRRPLYPRKRTNSVTVGYGRE